MLQLCISQADKKTSHQYIENIYRKSSIQNFKQYKQGSCQCQMQIENNRETQLQTFQQKK